MEDPEVGPFFRKLITKIGPMMGGMGGSALPANDNDDGIPGLDDLPDLE
jgi:hypothetical protein